MHGPFWPEGPPMIQIAGVIDASEAAALVAAGVTYLGFPLRLAVHQPDCSEAEAARMIAGLPAGVHGVVITYLDQAEAILAFLDELGADAVQLHGPIQPIQLQRLREARPNLFIIKSLVIRRDNVSELLQQVQECALWVDAFITDTYDAASGASGATGKTHDWGVSRTLVTASPKPVILAGGLHPANVAEAIRQVRPAGVDVHTGVEAADGRKAMDKVTRFLGAARRAYQALRDAP
ncbi:phosphoribosylanthranilate isomerase [Acanthopleuribacter pedis]|uniref:N-(5'-phosphoribosyl)anthranilate isomerase n=1 Tax=Acanthopleuribacter pedis TaxID=442870 RepID=A0A8J7QKG5_9BACT|nr:phosphoribosylanthranilate isomerase [Acanthopleuribacter pedis]MBO1322661.1 phosphoribosylanthranilate isomerase [Acanthopleuribacter pedis]